MGYLDKLAIVALIATFLPVHGSAQEMESSWRPNARVVINRDVGLLLGLGGERQLRDSTGTITGVSGIRVERSTEVGAYGLAGWGERRLTPTIGVAARSEFSGVRVLRWFGLGNETSRGNGQPIRTPGDLLALSGEVSLGQSQEKSIGIGFAARHHSFSRPAGDSLADLPGIGAFSIAGPRIRFTQVESRGSNAVAVEAVVAWYPLSQDLDSGSFADLSIRAVWLHHLTTDSALSLTTKLRSTRTIGDAPFQEMARLGGGPWLRGWQRDRFVGDIGMAAAGVELHLRLGSIDSLTGRDISGTIGALAFVDAGRVWHRGENSSLWHHSTGVGLWLKPRGNRFGLDDAPMIYGALVRAEGRFALDGGVVVRY